MLRLNGVPHRKRFHYSHYTFYSLNPRDAVWSQGLMTLCALSSAGQGGRRRKLLGPVVCFVEKKSAALVINLLLVTKSFKK